MGSSTKIYSSSVFMLFMASLFTSSSYAYQFNVGGRAGWVVNPPENYNHWAGRLRFQVNDTLFFKYEQSLNSVLEVNKDDYGGCNISNPILKLEDGNSIFKFDRSGPFYFISGNKTLCDQGQKIIIVVLAIRHNKTPPPAVTPSPAAQPPVLPPAPAPSGPPEASPAPAPVPGPSVSPSASPAATPETPGAVSPPPPPSSSGETPTPPSSSGSPPNGSSPGNINSPPGSGAASAKSAFTASTVLILAVSFCL